MPPRPGWQQMWSGPGTESSLKGGVGDLVTVDAAKAEVLLAFFASAFIRKVFQVFVPRDRVQEGEELSNGGRRSIKAYLEKY